MAEAWNHAYLDMILVPFGLLLLVLYHAQLIYRVWKFPASTVIGVNQINRQVWVRTIMTDGLKNGVLAVQTLRNNIMASTLLATAAITLCSLIGVLVSSKSDANPQKITLVLGDKTPLTSSIKLLCVLVCFLVAFLCNVQSVRYYSHVSFLISIPLGDSAPGLTPEYVNRAIIRGSQFWSIGLRAFYFSCPMFLWLFGPIPMFLCSVLLTTLLHILDTAEGFNQKFSISHKFLHHKNLESHQLHHKDLESGD